MPIINGISCREIEEKMYYPIYATLITEKNIEALRKRLNRYEDDGDADFAVGNWMVFEDGFPSYTVTPESFMDTFVFVEED